jgi:pimeloyl-ACP methyl ester carboxylesterase
MDFMTSSRKQESIHLGLPGGGRVHTYFSHENEPGDWSVVSVHGFGSVHGGEKAQALEAACARRGWSFAAFDFRGHGGSSGSMLELRGSSLLEDLEAVRAHLAERGVRRLGLFGSSMGGWAAAWFALRHPRTVFACVLLAPAFDFPSSRWSRLDEAERLRWQQTGRHRVQNEWVDAEIGYGLVEEIEDYPVDRLADEWCTPLLIFHGVQDDVVPYTHSIALMERTVLPHVELRLLKGGDHRLIAYRDEIAEAACAFLARWQTPAGQPGSAIPCR